MTAMHITNKNVILSIQIEKVTPETPEPPAGSVVMLHGLTGTAWQRFYNDGKWHSVTGQVRGWSYFRTATRRLGRDDTFIILHGEEDTDE